MEGQRQRRIGIVGSGIIGVQLSRGLQERGWEVTLLDRRDPGTGTSYGNAGFFAADEIFPLAHGRVLRSLPRMLRNPLGPLSLRWQELPRLAPWFLRYARACSSTRASHSIRALALLQSHTADAWRRVVVRNRLGPLVRETGAWKLFETDHGYEATATEREVQKSYGIAWEIVKREQLKQELPEVGPSVRHAVYYPGGMSTINPLALTQALVERFTADGGHFIKTDVLGLRPRLRESPLVITAAREMDFDSVVVAAGHLSGRLLKPLGFKVPLVAERGYHVEVSHPELSFNMPIGVHERGFYMTPMTSGLRLAGTSEFSSADHDEAPDWARADILVRHVSEILPGIAGEETGRWMGHRPTLPDFLPVLGSAPGCAGLFLAFGHQHLGLTLSAVTSEIMSRVITDGAPPFDITPFALARFR